MKLSRLLCEKRPADSRGFTLIEIVVILAVLAILVATLSPVVLKYIADAQLNRAKGDVTQISTAINSLIQDTGQYPGDKHGVNMICGPGTLATAGATGWATATSGAAAGAFCHQTGFTSTLDSISNHLIVNDPNENAVIGTGSGDYRTSGTQRWKGPYIQTLNEDPWGNAYEVHVANLKGGNTNPSWVLSAGPDGIFQTATTDNVIAAGSDDIGIRIK